MCIYVSFVLSSSSPLWSFYRSNSNDHSSQSWHPGHGRFLLSVSLSCFDSRAGSSVCLSRSSRHSHGGSAGFGGKADEFLEHQFSGGAGEFIDVGSGEALGRDRVENCKKKVTV
jgi:hypothetical protein